MQKLRQEPRQAYWREFLTFPHIAGMVGLFALSFVWTLWNSTKWFEWISLLIGIATYGVSEYATHRFLFHMQPPKRIWMRRLVERLHYHHHEDPTDLHLLFLPLWYTIPNFLIAGAIFYAVTGRFVEVNAFLTGVMGYLLVYEWMHYVAHRPIVPRTPWGRWMKKVHLWHHFKNEHYWFGVTNPGMDFLLGTFEDERSVPKSTSVRKLYAEESVETDGR